MKLPARVHLRRATLPPMPFPAVVVIKFGASLPFLAPPLPPPPLPSPPLSRKRRTKTRVPSRKKTRETRSCDHGATHSRFLDPRERAAPRRAAPVESARDDAGVDTSRYRRTRMRDARGTTLSASLREGPASRRAAQLTPLAARS